MITKITLDYPTRKGYEKDAHYQHQKIEQAAIDAKNVADNLAKVAGLLSFLNQYPDHYIPAAIGAFFGPQVTADVKNVTKTKRMYWIPGIYIHEEITKEQAEAETLFYKKMVNCILIGKPGRFTEYSSLDLKVPIASLIGHHDTEVALVEALAKVELKEGEQILNTNIPADLISYSRLTDEA